MDILVYDTTWTQIAVLDVFESSLWTERYNEYGDFEILTLAQDTIIDQLQEDYYLVNRDSETVMIIEDIEIVTDEETGDSLVVTGRSVESLLDWRIIWGQKTLNGNLQTGIEELINESIISPTDTNRTIPNFIFEASTDPLVTALTLQAQFYGDLLGVAIMKICSAENIGFKVIVDDNFNFVFKLYAGVDRSYDQIINPYVLFSPKNDNLINSRYFTSKRKFKNVTLIAGEGDGSNRKSTTFGSGAGMSRREIFTDGKDLSQTTSGGTLTDTEYFEQLQQKGKENLEENTRVTAFEGEAESTLLYRYGVAFFMGDIVQIENEYGIQSKSRVVEVVRSQATSGIDIYPTFRKIE